jgi:hypothetical protein
MQSNERLKFKTNKSILDPNHQILSLKKKRTSQEFLEICYRPEIIGPYEINLYKNDSIVVGSPLYVYVSDPNKVKVNKLENKAKVNQVFSFEIDAKEAGEGFIRVNIKGT